MKTFLFYDIETTGLNPAFDQILQFSAIRTDLSLNELDREKISFRLRADIVPSPDALITNRISVADAHQGVSELEGVVKIHGLMNQPGTVSLGYNSLAFDDEFLRFAFFRNLLPPYTHQYRDGCGRMDILPFTLIFWLYHREVLKWPQIGGKPTLKLEHLNAANDLASGPAHDATADVEATVALARRFRSAAKMWHYLTGYFDKKEDSRRIASLPETVDSPAGSHPMGLMVLSEYGPERLFQAPVLGIGQSVPYNNQSLWLRLDLPQLRDTTTESIGDTPWVVRKKSGEPGLLLPPLERYWQRLDVERRDEVDRNKHWLQANGDLFLKIIDHHRRFEYEPIPDLDLDASLYEVGFYSSGDDALCRRFHQGDLETKIALVSQFSAAPLRELARRCLGRNFEGPLPVDIRRSFENHLERVRSGQRRRSSDFRGRQRFSVQEAHTRIASLRVDPALDDSQRRILDGLESYLKQAFKAGH